MNPLAADLSYKARALAQAHPLSAAARRVTERVVSDQQATQPLPEIAVWASIGLLHGYCLRRVEEDAAGWDTQSAPPITDADLLDRLTDQIASDVRVGEPAAHLLLDEEVVLDALNRLVGSQLERRRDHLGDHLAEAAWAELEEYLAYWVVRGYALRVAEWTTTAPAS